MNLLHFFFNCFEQRCLVRIILNVFYQNQNQAAISSIAARPGLGKIDCNRNSIAIFFTFCSSNALQPLLF